MESHVHNEFVTKSTIMELETFRGLVEKSIEYNGMPKNINEDEFLLRFLRTKDMDCVRALELFDRYHKMRRNYGKLFAQMLPNNSQGVYDAGIVTKVKGKDLAGRTGFLFRFANWDTRDFSMDDIYLGTHIVLEELSYIPEVQENGVFMIHDFKGFNFSHFRQMTLANFLRILQILQGNFPLRFKAIHQVNQPSLFYILYKAFYPLAPKKIQERYFMHGMDMESLISHFPSSTLPFDLGGSADSCVDKAFMKSFYTKQDYYEKQSETLASVITHKK